MVQVTHYAFLDYPFDHPHVGHVAGFRVDFTLDGHIELVIVPVIVGVAAAAEDFEVKLFRPSWIEEPVRRIEVHSPSDHHSAHER